MNEPLLLAIVAVFAALFVLMAVALLRLWREQKKLKQALGDLHADIHRSSGDVAGLCSAALAVDKRLAANESRLSTVLDDLNTRQQAAPPPQTQVIAEDDDEQPQGYQKAIEKIRRGAGLEELVKSCGLTRDEAVLLIRLHGR